MPLYMIVFPRILRLPEMEGHMKSLMTSIAAVSVLVLACPLANWAATDPAQTMTCSQMEEFLRLGARPRNILT